MNLINLRHVMLHEVSCVQQDIEKSLENRITYRKHLAFCHINPFLCAAGVASRQHPFLVMHLNQNAPQARTR